MSRLITIKIAGSRSRRSDMLVWEGHKAAVTCLAFAPNGHLATGDRLGVRIVRDAIGERVYGGEGVAKPDETPVPVTSVSFRSDGKFFWTAGNVLTAARWDGTRYGVWSNLFGFAQPVAAVGWLTGSLLAVGCGDRMRPQAGNFL